LSAQTRQGRLGAFAGSLLLLLLLLLLSGLVVFLRHRAHIRDVLILGES
jgi:hypothetical protein